MPKLENWAVITKDVSPYLAPELRKPCLTGNIFDDDRFVDGTIITTSAITDIDQRKIRTKSGTIYELGKVKPEYQKQFPDYNLDGPNPIKFI